MAARANQPQAKDLQTKSWTLTALKARAEEYDGRFERAALETLSGLEAFSRAGRARQPSSGTASKKSRETYSLKVPKFGVECSPADEKVIEQVLERIDQWGLDVHTIAEHSGGHPLVVMMFAIFKRRDLLKFLAIDESTFLSCLYELERHYQTEPSYHNVIHAADVTHSVHVILNGSTLQVSIRPKKFSGQVLLSKQKPSWNSSKVL